MHGPLGASKPQPWSKIKKTRKTRLLCSHHNHARPAALPSVPYYVFDCLHNNLTANSRYCFAAETI